MESFPVCNNNDQSGNPRALLPSGMAAHVILHSPRGPESYTCPGLLDGPVYLHNLITVKNSEMALRLKHGHPLFNV